jgi:hypothetical protein
MAKPTRRHKLRKYEWHVVYKIIYPNHKIYVGSDWTDDICYFGSSNAAAIAKDFTRKQRRDMIVRRQILWESKTASYSQMRKIEKKYILALGANDPAKGYNRSPKFRPS